jgi:hypothetical protein
MVLELYGEYDRRGIHDIFSPDTPFEPSRGTWGLQGIVPLPHRPGDFVLLVTYGQEQGDHAFDEGISSGGILRWQSQPKQTFEHPQIASFLRHDPARNTIHLFLRAQERRSGLPAPYTYLGTLARHSHDAERQEPVHIAWQLLQWPIPEEVLSRIDLRLEDEQVEPVQDQPRSISRNTLCAEDPPAPQNGGEPTHTFRAAKRRYISERETRELGLAGELLVLTREQKILVDMGRSDLAERVRHISVIEGDGAGYDILSYFPDGQPKFIEVKTTRGPKTTDFWISPTEVAFSATNASSYELCRVFDYDPTTVTGGCYSIFGDISRFFLLTPTEYRARPGATAAKTE